MNASWALADGAWLGDINHAPVIKSRGIVVDVTLGLAGLRLFRLLDRHGRDAVGFIELVGRRLRLGPIRRGSIGDERRVGIGVLGRLGYGILVLDLLVVVGLRMLLFGNLAGLVGGIGAKALHETRKTTRDGVDVGSGVATAAVRPFENPYGT